MPPHSDDFAGRSPETSCRPLVAVELGFQTRLLRTLQESVWSIRLTDVQDVDKCMESIRRRLIALSDRLNEVQFSCFGDLATRIEERHELASFNSGQVRFEILDETDDPTETDRLLPQMLAERTATLRAWQQQDWDELKLLCWKAVEGDRRLEGWWEIGLRMADIVLRRGTTEVPASWSDGDLAGLLAAIAKLPPEEKVWIEDMVPSTSPTEARFPFLVQSAYNAMREFVVTFEHQRPHESPCNPPDDPSGTFVHSDDFRVCTWHGRQFEFSKTQALMIEALYLDWQHGGAGLSADRLFEAAGSDRTERRVARVFQTVEHGRTVRHPAAVAGLILNVGGGVWQLGLKKARKRP